MRVYEFALVLKSSPLGKQKKIVDEIKNYLKGLKITKEEEVGKKTLSYKIKREDSGYYMNFLFEGDSIPVDFEKKLLANEGVLRHLLLRKK